ncbi:MAG TPA: hypothetical protein VJ965_01645 [Anaerolineales bacterium]|nr:hypothetical protein [Anaerolineales bacterium]
MKKFEITETDKGLNIEVKASAGQEQQLLDEFQKCQQGQCSCPTDEYKKLEKMDLDMKDGEIQIQLTAKQDQKFNREEITRCLEHTTNSQKTDQ